MGTCSGLLRCASYSLYRLGIVIFWVVCFLRGQKDSGNQCSIQDGNGNVADVPECRGSYVDRIGDS